VVSSTQLAREGQLNTVTVDPAHARPASASRLGKGNVFQMPGSPYWYIRYSINGRQIRESTHSPDRAVAENLLEQRLAECERRRAQQQTHRMARAMFERFSELTLVRAAQNFCTADSCYTPYCVLVNLALKDIVRRPRRPKDAACVVLPHARAFGGRIG
jgi:hypothetical protein